MSSWIEIGLALLLGPALWLAGAIFFDLVHYLLHRMLHSRLRPLRALAWPHAVHHLWIDRQLQVRWEFQRRNLWCHIVPEYGTQLLFTAGVAAVLPLPFVLVLFLLQTAIFLLILRSRGLDLNHRPITLLDAYRPGPWTPPAYHALHHVYPDAYFSAYTKAIDFLVGGAAELRERRFALVDARNTADLDEAESSPFGKELAEVLRRQGAKEVARVARSEDLDMPEVDVVVLCQPPPDEEAFLEALIQATQTRKLPPEAWVVHEAPEERCARHYVNDVRIHYRTLVVPEAVREDPRSGARAARRAVARIRRGHHFVSTATAPRAFSESRRFRATAAARPRAAARLRHRTELLDAA